MAHVWEPPAETAAQPNVAPAVAATGTGMVASDVLPSAMPSRPELPSPAKGHGGMVGYTRARSNPTITRESMPTTAQHSPQQ